ncbi:MAG: hypothetical protein OXD36_03900 [Rhodobacter sp.]|nr:hypothetical protein [Rhodobacter sp.]
MKLLAPLFLGLLGSCAGMLLGAAYFDLPGIGLCALAGLVLGAVFPFLPKPGPTGTEDGITQGQESFLIDLCDENPELALNLDLHDDDAIADLSKDEASALIDRFLEARER